MRQSLVKVPSEIVCPCAHLLLNFALFVTTAQSKNVKVRIYKAIILPVVLHGCETWPLRVRDENKPRVFENKVLRRIFGPKRDGVTGR
jgi:hypothetical protein